MDQTLPVFDPRKTRQAIRRGLLRTAVRSAVLLLVALFLLNLAGTLIQNRGGRGERMHRVLETAFLTAHPDYQSVGGRMTTDWASMTLTIEAAPLTPRTGSLGESTRRPDTTSYKITQDLFGNLTDSQNGLQSNLSAPLGWTGEHEGTRDDARKWAENLFARLPASLTATAVVDFDHPLTPEQFKQFYNDIYNATNDDSAGAPPTHTLLLSSAGNGSSYRTPIGWSPRLSTLSEENFDSTSHELSDWATEAVSTFRAWVAQLHGYDADNLRNVGIDLSHLRAAAKDGRIYGYIAVGEPIDKLRKLLADPRVRTIRPGDVAFNLG